MTEMPSIDYGEFLSKRYDLVVKYRILRGVGYDFEKAYRTVTEGKEFSFLRGVYRELGKTLPKKTKRTGYKLARLFDDAGDLIIHNLFFVKNFQWLERVILDGSWLKENPYGVRPDNRGIPGKRFLVALKLNKPLYWSQEPFMVHYKTRMLRTQDRDEYRRVLSAGRFAGFEKVMGYMMEHMNVNRFFYPEFRVRVHREKYRK
jgi:hypothetical protein